jgi:hypothetical protein
MESATACKVVVLDSRRPKGFVELFCTFCHTERAVVVTLGKRYYSCTGCDEIAAVPVRRVTG